MYSYQCSICHSLAVPDLLKVLAQHIPDKLLLLHLNKKLLQLCNSSHLHLLLCSKEAPVSLVKVSLSIVQNKCNKILNKVL